ncbi:MAG: phosphoglycerate kinase [Candidatus Aminicenantes bacterium]|jgi:phosphoglycerate kinase
MLFLKDLDFKGKTVFLRVDFNVPLDDERNIRDDTRIKAALPTINFLLEQGVKLIIASHLGRPKGNFVPELSLKPAAQRLSELLSLDVTLAPDVINEEVTKLKKTLEEGQVLLLENVRFHNEETANDANFAQALAQEVDYYVNDAFGTCHRAHASVVAITQYVEKSAAGFLVKKEVDYLSKIVHSPEKPLVAILGGAKVSDKIPVIESLLKKADNILIGGAMAYTFFKAQGYDVGRSLVEEDKIELARNLLNRTEEEKRSFFLPLDHIIAPEADAGAESQTTETFPLPSDMMALDIGPRTVEKYSEIISRSKTIFWNGPMGVFEIDQFSQGTTKIAEAVAHSESLSIIGGGDSVAAIYKSGVAEKISHISTGGGASLEFIAKETLPGIDALTEK